MTRENLNTLLRIIHFMFFFSQKVVPFSNISEEKKKDCWQSTPRDLSKTKALLEVEAVLVSWQHS